jgi:hypothetical protein
MDRPKCSSRVPDFIAMAREAGNFWIDAAGGLTAARRPVPAAALGSAVAGTGR